MEVIAGMPLFIQILKNYYPDPELVLNQPNDVTAETYIKLRPERNLSDFLRKVPVTVKGQGYNPVQTRLDLPETDRHIPEYRKN